MIPKFSSTAKRRTGLTKQQKKMKEDKMRTNVEVDRLSSLPDDLIHKILSFIDIKYAVQTSCLSSKWRFVWTSMPCLNFSSEVFVTLSKFYKFVYEVLSRRNNQIEVSSVELSIREKVSLLFVNRFMNYAFSHNVQQLTITCFSNFERIRQFPPSLFSSRSLKHLTLTNSVVACSITPTSTWDLPALTTLHVSHVKFWQDSHENSDKFFGFFSMCANLKNLSFKHLRMTGLSVFSICHPQISNLTLENIEGDLKVFDVVAPQLENLTIKYCSMEYQISAPDLSSFHYEGFCPLQFSTDGFHSLEKVNLCFHSQYEEDAPTIIGLLQQVHSAKFLRLSSEIVELLSSYIELLRLQPSPFANLKSLNIYPLHLEEELDKKVIMSTEVRNYLLDNSPNATVTIVSRKELRDAKNAKLAQKLIKEVQVLLEKWKTNSETNGAHMEAEMQVKHEQGRTQVDLGKRMAQMESYWEDLRVQIEQAKSETCGILSTLLHIEELLAKLPARQRDEMLPRFFCMRAEADALLNGIIGFNFIHCDKKRRR